MPYEIFTFFIIFILGSVLSTKESSMSLNLQRIFPREGFNVLPSNFEHSIKFQIFLGQAPISWNFGNFHLVSWLWAHHVRQQVLPSHWKNMIATIACCQHDRPGCRLEIKIVPPPWIMHELLRVTPSISYVCNPARFIITVETCTKHPNAFTLPQSSTLKSSSSSSFQEEHPVQPISHDREKENGRRKGVKYAPDKKQKARNIAARTEARSSARSTRVRTLSDNFFRHRRPNQDASLHSKADPPKPIQQGRERPQDDIYDRRMPSSK